jgi:hypothetical protein
MWHSTSCIAAPSSDIVAKSENKKTIDELTIHQYTITTRLFFQEKA